ncbi:hypothetical protein NPIL_660811, partial [Nephila pilipes]
LHELFNVFSKSLRRVAKNKTAILNPEKKRLY